MEVVSERGISEASMFCILVEHLRRWKICTQWISHVLNSDQHAMHMLLSTIYFHIWKREEERYIP
jgi:hypothetical protein